MHVSSILVPSLYKLRSNVQISHCQQDWLIQGMWQIVLQGKRDFGYVELAICTLLSLEFCPLCGLALHNPHAPLP